MKFLIPKLVLLFVCCVGSIGDSHHANASDTIEMTNPDGLVMATVSLNAQSELAYEVQWKENIVIEPSSLGITVDDVDFGKAVRLGNTKQSSHDETYVTRGVHAKARNHYNKTTIPVMHAASGKQCKLEFRIYNDGVAYRYVVESDEVQHVNGESSSWKLTSGQEYGDIVLI